MSQSRGQALVIRLKARATSLGFSAFGIASAAPDAGLAARLKAFLNADYHGSMAWLKDTFERRQSPQHMWRQAKSAIVLGLNYGPEFDPLATLQEPGKATISVYARGRDYHDVLKGKLKELAGLVARETGDDVKVFVDTAPLMEKPLAAKAGLGWQGKHTNLVSRDHGSWLFLGVILTAAELPLDDAEEDHCGSCQACLDVCPTNAFPAPYQLDARRCISYLTIEHKGPIPRAFRAAMGNRIYGCDDCLAVCPWNKFASQATEVKLQARDVLNAPALSDLVRLDEAAFRTLFSRSPIKRIGRTGFLRNVLIAIGNSGRVDFVPLVLPHLEDADPVLRGAAIWALGQLMDRGAFGALRMAKSAAETDQEVLDEWALAQESGL